MRIYFTVPVAHALTHGIRDGEHSFDVDPSTLDPALRARLLACYKAGNSPEDMGKVEPLGTDLESFIAAHEHRRDTEAQKLAANRAEEEAKRLDRQRRDADIAAGVTAALAAHLALPEGESFDILSLPSAVQSALLGSRTWKAERERRDALRAAKRVAERAEIDKAAQAVVRGLLTQAKGDALVERYDAGFLPEEESVLACEQVLFGSDLCALDTSRSSCSMQETDCKHTAQQWAQRKLLIKQIESLSMEGWTFNHGPLVLGKSVPGRYVQAVYMGDPGMSYRLDLAYSASDVESLKKTRTR